MTDHNIVTITDERGHEFDWEAVVNLMDDDLREELHFAMAPCNPQEFYDAYCKRHFEKYGEDFIIN